MKDLSDKVSAKSESIMDIIRINPTNVAMQTAFVVGASRGLGKEIAKSLAGKGKQHVHQKFHYSLFASRLYYTQEVNTVSSDMAIASKVYHLKPSLLAPALSKIG
jgi:hypothetical protein